MENELKILEEQKSDTANKDLVENFKIDDLISSVFKDKSKKPEIIQNFVFF